MAKITVVVPVYNSADYLPRLFDALSKQELQDFKCLFVYDKSTDDTLNVLQTEIGKYQNLSCFLLKKENKEGVGKARDYAIDSGEIKSDYVIFLDADDMPHADYLRKLYENINKNKSDIAICGFNRISGVTGKTIATEMIHNKPLISDLSSNMSVPLINPAPWNKIFRYSAIKDARFIYKAGGEDTLFLCKVLPNCEKISFINEVLYDYFVNTGSSASLTDVALLDLARNGFIETKDFYIKHNYGENWLEVLTAFAFLRIGIGLTTRTCLACPKQRKSIIKNTRKFLDKEFHGWRKNKYWSFSACLKRGFKTLFVWNCRVLYKQGLFSLFVFAYKFFTKLFKKDIKW
jgi:glycosyltransferase involved in cell wall biosynthesis